MAGCTDCNVIPMLYHRDSSDFFSQNCIKLVKNNFLTLFMIFRKKDFFLIFFYKGPPNDFFCETLKIFFFKIKLK